jgi:hypothetical protein
MFVWRPMSGRVLGYAPMLGFPLLRKVVAERRKPSDTLAPSGSLLLLIRDQKRLGSSVEQCLTRDFQFGACWALYS